MGSAIPNAAVGIFGGKKIQEGARGPGAPGDPGRDADFEAKSGRENQARIVEERRQKEEAERIEKERLRQEKIKDFQQGLRRVAADFPGRRQTILTNRAPRQSGKATFLTGLS